MKGIIGEYYDDIPIFIREDYEKLHASMSEKERLEEVLNVTFSTMLQAVTYAENHCPKLLYHKKGWAYDNWLTSGTFDSNLWSEYKSGYVHIITGEYVKSNNKPSRDSWPCWVVARNVVEYGKDKTLENVTNFALWLLSIF